MNATQYPLLMQINSPADLKQFSKEELPQICDELRQYLLNSVSRSSGHLASGLGVVELTTALHYVYDTPYDAVIWDVGHQAYPHKILTGRRDEMLTIRQKNGLHPFPWREESAYDVLSTGHSSTSISAALGIAIAEKRLSGTKKVTCVIGDGAITAGMAFEAMNHVGHVKPDMLVILNDNDMSISENVGALNQHFAKILSSRTYASLREGSKKVLAGLPPIKELLKKTEEHIKGMVTPGTFFEELGFNYIGPIDGHDVTSLVDILKKIRQLKGPQFLHVVTKKGKGYAPAEADPISWHGVPKFDPNCGTLPRQLTQQNYSDIFGNWLCETAKHDTALMAITPAMREGSGMTQFAQEYPEQFIDVAIAEQHAVTLASGLAIAGLKPVVAIYSTFLQRAYDQVIHDIAIPNLPVLFAIDRAGVVGADGQTHQGAFDLSYLRCIPNMVIMTPSDENECHQMLTTGYHYKGPAAVRYPRGRGPGAPVISDTPCYVIGQAKIKRQGTNIALLNFGSLLPEAMDVARELDATVLDMRFVKPLDEDKIKTAALSHDLIVTLEENAVTGGAGSAVNELLNQLELNCEILNLGLPDHFIPQGEHKEILRDLSLDANGIKQRILDRCRKTVRL